MINYKYWFNGHYLLMKPILMAMEYKEISVHRLTAIDLFTLYFNGK